jgi:prepilin-type N-terminal cleavage/methylation domain-containing protein
VTHAPPDGGFSLIELVVAMFVVALGLVSLVPLQLRSAQTVGLAHERQRATALANGALEQVRDAASAPSRAAAIVTGGSSTPAVGGWTAPVGEAVVTTATPDPSLDVQGPTATVPAFTTQLYVTVRSGDPQDTVWITAATTWTSANAADRAQRVVIRGLLFARTS